MHLSLIDKWVYATAAQESFVSIERLETKLGFAPCYSNRHALIRNYDWYAAHRDEYRGKTGIAHRLPWKKGALNSLSTFSKKLLYNLGQGIGGGCGTGTSRASG
jgi:hypothetical protein